MELQAPSRWRRIELLSDLHLCAQEPATFAAWRSYMESTRANALFILGDLFEVWVGDDVLLDPQSFEYQCAQVMRQAASRLDLYLMCGNRDFLMGEALMRSAHAKALPDPSLLQFGPQRILLSHGDALCLDDVAYQQFRQKVRSTAWQQDFLRKSLGERQAIARRIRTESEARKQADAGQPYVFTDLDTPAVEHLMASCQAALMIHGHTHQPACHPLAPGKARWVLSDWSANAAPPRADVICCTLQDDGSFQMERQAVHCA